VQRLERVLRECPDAAADESRPERALGEPPTELHLSLVGVLADAAQLADDAFGLDRHAAALDLAGRLLDRQPRQLGAALLSSR
jgi:hypothetical protein